MRVSELSGALLDYWVAKALGDRMTRIVGTEEQERCESRFGDQWPWNRFSPATAWMHGGPIIERERIGIEPWDDGHTGAAIWVATTFENRTTSLLSSQLSKSGATPLVAAMRCYVASKFCEEVPDEVPA